ncbi:iron ABC transporter permease [Selenomonadales bacterium OttesenSCG-928-I06]|nr:iron ABC transporter permease [Selenomonadales bacterium OttesenSCG-928-I06]
MKEMAIDPRSTTRTLASLAGIIALLVAAIAGIGLGAVHISPSEIYSVLTGSASTEASQIITNIRLPRVISGACVGINLAIAGCILQGIFSNPMADSGTTGISAGAGFAAILIMLVFPEHTALVPLAAFSGGMITACLVFWVAWKDGIAPLRLILSGMIIGSFCAALTTILFVFFSDRVQNVVTWMAGSLQTQTWTHVFMILPYTIIGLIGIIWAYRQLNLLQLGEEAAQGLGVNLNQSRLLLLALASLLAGSAVSVAGMIGFVGLIIPHIVRMIVGSDFEYLLPCSALFGSALLVGADTLSRFLFSPIEVPVGIFTALLGTPFFIYLLQKRSPR